jgi:hypothetical protein
MHDFCSSGSIRGPQLDRQFLQLAADRIDAHWHSFYRRSVPERGMAHD